MSGIPTLDRLSPALGAWVRKRFGNLTPAQELTLPHVLDGKSVLLSSPTGTGKTLAGFLGVFDALERDRAAGRESGLCAVYVSPLRALAYDLTRNLSTPLRELGWSHVTIATRTGDTTAAERTAQKRKPPTILVTTPESLCLLLAQSGWNAHFARLRFLILDELHALAANKRGTLLMLAAERLEAARGAGAPALQRIGLSATVAPLERLGAFLTGGRSCALIDAPSPRRSAISLLSPSIDHPYPPSGYTAERLLPHLAREVEKWRTTLVFTNTRGGAESVGLRLRELLPALADRIEVHHASLDRELRLSVEDRLKQGELRVVVCSTSLELGIDIGSIDLVVMVSAPKGVARALQRLGRSGHGYGEESRGLLVASNINDLAECAATALLMRKRAFEPVVFPENSLDVLAQHLVGLAVCPPGGLPMTPDEAFDLVRRAHPYRTLGRDDFDRVLRYLEGGGTSLELRYRDTFGKVATLDGRLVPAAGRVAREFHQNVGTIVTEPMVTVKLGVRSIGQLEESFVRRLERGDVFVLGGRSLRLLETKLLTAKVEDARGAMPTVPRWNANKMPLQSGVAAEVAEMRTRLSELLAKGDADGSERHLIDRYALTPENARALRRHFQLQATVSRIPDHGILLVEQVKEGAHLHLFVHSLVGRSANDALSRMLASRLHRMKGANALVTIDDYGFLLTIRIECAPAESDWAKLLSPRDALEDLERALANSELVKWHFRGVSQTALMVPRAVRGEERGQRQLQWSSEVLFEVLRRHEPEHPLLAEARAEARDRFLDTARAVEFLEKIEGRHVEVRQLPRVSPFAFGMFVSRIRETIMLEDPEAAVERLFHSIYGAELQRIETPP